jgi:pimeloyl-ACP methyl ester carboxylesterase
LSNPGRPGRSILPDVSWIRRATKVALIALGAAMAALVALYLVLLRPDIPFETLGARYANAASRYVDMPGGVRVHYRDQGNPAGPTLILIHGFGASLETWEPWVARLSGRYRLVSLDLPGHGLTRGGRAGAGIADDAELIEAFARRLGLPPAIVVGNSRGGAAAWNLALRRPERVKGLVLVDAPGWEWTEPRAGGDGGRGFARLLGSPAGAALLRNVDKSALIRQLLTSAFHDRRLATEAMIRRYVELSRAPGHRAILDATMARTMGGQDPDATATQAKLAGIRAPTLILWGEADELVAPAGAKRFAAAIPGARLVTYPGVGHIPMEEAPDRSAADLDAWIARTWPKEAR